MAKTKVQKQEMLAQYIELLKSSTGVIVVEQEGLTPADVTQFRKKLHTFDAKYHTVKNSIFNLALKEAGISEMAEFDARPHAVVFISEDIPNTAKALDEFMKSNKDKIQITAGVLQGQILDAAQAKALADLPTKEQSVAMIAGILQQSMVGVVNVLEDSMRSVVIILDKAFGEK